jgi:hypothetical protein
VARIIDGDTLELKDGRIVRLANINAPEKSSPNYQQSLNFLKPLENNTIELEVTGTDRYARTLARIFSNEYLNLELVKRGLATKFLVVDSESSSFAKAEQNAIENSLGIWEKSPKYNCFSSTIDEEAERIHLTNNCFSTNMEDWTLTDESSKTFKFPNLAIGSITLHSENGENNQTDLFWNSGRNIWNNDRDSLYLFDDQGKIAHYHSYGY